MTFQRLLPADSVAPRWSSGSFLVYSGAYVVLLATTSLLAILGNDRGDTALMGFSAAAAAAAVVLALALVRADRDVAAGVIATVAVVFFAVFVGSVENVLGILDVSVPFGRDYQPALLILELLTIAAAFVALRRFRAPLLLLPAAIAFWIGVVDLGSLGSWDTAEWLSLVVGIALIVAGLAVDRSGLRPYGFWLHLVGGVAFGGAILSLVGGTAGWLLVGALSLVFVGAATMLGRSSYAVLGFLGILATTTYFVQDGLALAGYVLPFDTAGLDSGREPWQIALWYLLAGLLILALGLVGERLGRARRADLAA